MEFGVTFGFEILHDPKDWKTFSKMVAQGTTDHVNTPEEVDEINRRMNWLGLDMRRAMNAKVPRRR
jgi:hypothetical protein